MVFLVLNNSFEYGLYGFISYLVYSYVVICNCRLFVRNVFFEEALWIGFITYILGVPEAAFAG